MLPPFGVMGRVLGWGISLPAIALLNNTERGGHHLSASNANKRRRKRNGMDITTSRGRGENKGSLLTKVCVAVSAHKTLRSIECDLACVKVGSSNNASVGRHGRNML